MGKVFKIRITFWILALLASHSALAVRTYRHPTVAWRESVLVTGGSITLEEVGIPLTFCNPAVTSPSFGVGPVTTSNVLLKDCHNSTAGSNPLPAEKYYSSGHPIALESWLVLTNISNIDQELSIKVSGGSLPFMFEGILPSLTPPSGGTHRLSFSCFPDLPDSAEISNFTTAGTMYHPARTSNDPNLNPRYRSVPAQTSIICPILPTFYPSSNVDSTTALGANFWVTVTGSYNIEVQIKDDRGAVSGTLYYNIVGPPHMAVPKNKVGFFSRQTYLLNGGNPF